MYAQYSSKGKSSEADPYANYYGMTGDDYDEYTDDGYGGGGEIDVDEARRLTEEAIKFAEAKEMDDALELFQQAVDANPRHGQYWENLGVTQVQNHQTAIAKFTVDPEARV